MRFGVLLAGLVASSGAWAATPVGPPVRVLLRECAEFREAEVERVLSAELALASTPREGAAREPTWVVARCAGSRVVLEVNDPLSRKTVQRSFDLSTSSPKARGRLVAIAAAELVLASWAELSQRPKLRVEPEGAPPDPDETRAAIERVRRPSVAARASETEEMALLPVRPSGRPAPMPGDRAGLRVVALGSGRGFTNHAGMLYGGGIRFGGEAAEYSGWALDALVETGSLATSGSGRFRVDTWTVGGMLYLCGGLGRHLTVRGGAGLRAGLAVSSSQAVSMSELAPKAGTRNSPAIWGWPMLAASSSLRVGRFVLDLSGEGGYSALPVSSATRGPSIRGIWFGGQVGVGVAL